MGILVSFTSARSLKLTEIQEAMEYIKKSANPDAFIKFGQADDDSMGEDLKITVIATGFPSRPKNDLTIDLGKRRHIKRPHPADELFDNFDVPNMMNTGMVDDDLEKPAYLRRRDRKLK